MNVEQNIIFPLLLDYQKPDQKYVEELLGILGLKERRKHLPSELSGGQQQRAAIGRALAARPAIIMADEPTGNLDSRNSQEVITLLKSMSAKYRQTILMITHNEKHADAADRVLRMTDGVYPSLPDEALLNESAMEEMGLSIGDDIMVTVPDDSQKQYRITGTLADMGSMMKADICGMALSEEGFYAIADENAADGTTYRIQFKDGVHIQEAIKEIKAQLCLSDAQVSENTVLLGLMGQSGSNIMQAFYLIAAILVFLVLIAGTVMISASFHTNVLERTKEYGLLRCLGASRKQVKHFVILQGLRQSAKGVPIGLLAGQIVTWAACLLLRSISGNRFLEVPLFEFSIVCILAGIVVGFLDRKSVV